MCIIVYYFKGMYECVSVFLCCIIALYYYDIIVLHYVKDFERVWIWAIQIPFWLPDWVIYLLRLLLFYFPSLIHLAMNTAKHKTYISLFYFPSLIHLAMNTAKHKTYILLFYFPPLIHLAMNTATVKAAHTLCGCTEDRILNHHTKCTFKPFL